MFDGRTDLQLRPRLKCSELDGELEYVGRALTLSCHGTESITSLSTRRGGITGQLEVSVFLDVLANFQQLSFAPYWSDLVIFSQYYTNSVATHTIQFFHEYTKLAFLAIFCNV